MAFAGALVNASFPILIVSAQDLAPESEATACGMLMGLTVGIAGVLYVGVGRLPESVGLAPPMAGAYLLLVPAAAVASVLMSASTVIVAINAQLLRRARL